jgi:hypothetical protein
MTTVPIDFPPSEDVFATLFLALFMRAPSRIASAKASPDFQTVVNSQA